MLVMNVMDMMQAPNTSAKSSGNTAADTDFSKKFDMVVAGSGTYQETAERTRDAARADAKQPYEPEEHEEEEQPTANQHIPFAPIPILTAEQSQVFTETPDAAMVITESTQNAAEIPVNVVNVDTSEATQAGAASTEAPVMAGESMAEQPVIAAEIPGKAQTEPTPGRNIGAGQAAPDVVDELQMTETASQTDDALQNTGSTESQKENSQLFSKLTKESTVNVDNSFVKQAMDEATVAAKANNNAAENDYKMLDTTKVVINTTEAENANADTDDTGQQPQQAKTQAETPMATNATANNNFEVKLENVSQSQAEPAPPAQNVKFQIVDQVRSMVSESKQELTLQLKPHHLGGLKITLTADQNGIVAKLVTASKDAHMLIQSEMATMQAELREKGIHVVEMEVIYDQMANTTGKENSDNGQGTWSGNTFQGNHGGLQETAESAMLTYDDLSGYDILAEQGGSVEFSA